MDPLQLISFSFYFYSKQRDSENRNQKVWNLSFGYWTEVFSTIFQDNTLIQLFLGANFNIFVLPIDWLGNHEKCMDCSGTATNKMPGFLRSCLGPSFLGRWEMKHRHKSLDLFSPFSHTAAPVTVLVAGPYPWALCWTVCGEQCMCLAEAEGCSANPEWSSHLHQLYITPYSAHRKCRAAHSTS